MAQSGSPNQPRTSVVTGIPQTQSKFEAGMGRPVRVRHISQAHHGPHGTHSVPTKKSH